MLVLEHAMGSSAHLSLMFSCSSTSCRVLALALVRQAAMSDSWLGSWKSVPN